jgi:hypothetical protein
MKWEMKYLTDLLQNGADLTQRRSSADILPKIKMAIRGVGTASKEQVADMLRRMMKLDREEMGKFLDATDALAAAYCHFLQMGKPETDRKYSSWKDFVNKNKDRQTANIAGLKTR